MSIFKESFKAGIQDQLKKRQEAINNRTSQNLTYYNSRNAWIRMTSAVNTEGTNALAKKYILQGGTLNSSGKLRSGLGQDGAYSNISPNGAPYGQINGKPASAGTTGIRPMPGITSIEVKSKSAYGSLREVTVNFNAWTIQQLEDLELLYMRPGYTVLVEWGWLPYLNNNGSLINNVSFIDDVLNGGKTKEEIWKNIFTKASSNGNYDAIYGFIKNYGWSARTDGGYDCTVSVITMGEILESLKVNYTKANSDSIKSGVFSEESVSKPFDPNSEISKSYSKNLIAGLCNEMYEIALKTLTSANTEADISLNGEKYTFCRFDVDITNRQDAADTFLDNPAQIYITLESLCKIINKYVTLQDEQGKTAMVNLSTKDGAHSNTPGADLLCLGDIYQLSIDPSVCLIKNDAWQNPASLGFAGDFSTIKNLMSGLKTNYWYNGKFNLSSTSAGSPCLGVIGHIFVNLGYIYSLITSDELASQDKKEKKEIILYDFIKNILSGINNTIGNVATLDLFVDPVDSVARIIDVNYVDSRTRQEAYENAFLLQMHNLKSTVRSYKLESQIFPEQSSIIAIGAQVKGGALGTNTNTLVDFNAGLEDRIVPAKTDPISATSSTNDGLESKIKNLKESINVIVSYLNTIDADWYESLFGKPGDFDVSDSTKYANALRDIINFKKELIADDSKNRAIIPTKLSIEMDGIGGIIIGNMFRIPDDLLPRGYKGNGTGPTRIAYLVTGIGNSVQNNDWTTKLDAQFIVLDDPKGVDLAIWNKVLVQAITIVAKVIDVASPAEVQAATTEIQAAVEETKKVIDQNKTTENPTPRPSVGKTCKEIYYVINQSVAPGVNIPDKTSWANIKKAYPIRSAEVPVIAIGTPLDSGNDFHYKMNNTKVSRRTSPINYIVLHYTVSEKNDPTYHYKNTWEKTKSSADFSIGRTGQIAGFKNFKTNKAWHYGEAAWPGGDNFNNESIGFEIESIGWAYYCKTNNKFYTSYHTELKPNEVALTRTYRGHNIWHYHTDVQISAIANLIIALYNSGAISNKTAFLSNCTGNNRIGTLFPEAALTTKPPPGVLTHGTGRPPSGKVDTFPQKNLLDMLDELPTLIKNNPRTYIQWIK